MGKNKKHHNTTQPIAETKTEPIEIADAIVDGVQSMLNVRSTPEIKEGNVIATLENGSGVKVEEPKKDHSGFYKIIIVDKEDKPKKGYAMKKFIKII